MLKKSISTFLVFALMIPYLTPAFDVAKAEPAGTEASSWGGGFSSPLLGGVDERAGMGVMTSSDKPTPVKPAQAGKGSGGRA